MITDSSDCWTMRITSNGEITAFLSMILLTRIILDDLLSHSIGKLDPHMQCLLSPVCTYVTETGFNMKLKWLKVYNKPIIGIEPWGSQRIPAEVQSAATTMVGWRTDSIVTAIRVYAI